MSFIRRADHSQHPLFLNTISSSMATETDDDRSSTLLLLHSLGNRLGLLPSELQRMRGKDLPEEEQRRLERISEWVREALQLLVEFQDAHVRPPAGSRTQLAVNDVVRKVVDSYQNAMRSAHTIDPRIQQNLSENLPDIRANERLLSEVVRNLLDNAVRAASSAPTPLVTLSTALLESGVVVDVFDNGPGIPDTTRTNLFSRPIPSAGPSGSGIGLLASRQVVRSWEGDLELYETGPRGTVMRLSLPIFRPHPVVSGKRALVVDDQAPWRTLIAGVLANRGFVIDEAATAAAARELIAERGYDIAFVDIRLDENRQADAAGIDLIRILREANPQALLVLLSAYVATDSLRGAFKLGVDDILLKQEFSPEATDRLLDDLAVKFAKSKEALLQTEWRGYIYELLATFSHELREPLVTIHRNAEALSLGALGALTDAQRRAVRSIETAVQREFLLINAHLDLNKIERGVAKLNDQEHDLLALVREEVAAHDAGARERQVRLRTELPDRPALVQLDVIRLRTALNPLIENAIKFSREGGEVVVSAYLGSDFIEVSIEDQGPGMRPDEIDALLVWHPEERRELSSRMRSSGLGLSMAKRIVELHRGKLWITSDGRHGTAVTFRLPIGRTIAP